MQKLIQVRTRHHTHAEQRRFVFLPPRLAQELATELTSIERLGGDRSPSRARARRPAVDIGNPGPAHELELGVLFEEAHHLRSCLEERRDFCSIVVSPKLMLEIL